MARKKKAKLPVVEIGLERDDSEAPAPKHEAGFHEFTDKLKLQWLAHYPLLRERVISGWKTHYPRIRARAVSGWKHIRRVRYSPANSLTNSLLSGALNIAVFVGVGITAATISYGEPPATRYPLSKTLGTNGDRKLVLHAADGTRFANRGGCVESAVHVEELPPHFIAALLSMEDRRFYDHLGVDVVGIARAALANYQAGYVVQGGSTLTQQLAKMAYLTGVKSFNRKAEEAIIALRLELELSKNEILERYLSSAYFGDGCYGLRAATRNYFKKDIAELTVPESAYLVALLPSPTMLSNNRDKAMSRARMVLNAMAETGSSVNVELEEIKTVAPPRAETREIGSYYADWIAQTAKLPDDGKMTPLPVKTSFDSRLQETAEKAVEWVMNKVGKSHRAGQAALVAMRPDGRVLAMVGGRDYDTSTFNRATQAMRQPGSAFKTFVYLAALRGGADPNMTIYDEPLSIGDWSPKNYGHGYRGPVSMTQAFAASINTVAVRLSETVGRRHVIEAAHDLGIRSKIDPNPSLALGSFEVTLLELTSAYAAVAADAYPVRPKGIESIAGTSQQVEGSPSGEWRLERGNELRQLLATTVQSGTGRGARVPVPAYGKTGTSQDFRDAWFVGFAGNLVVGVWVGNDDNTSMRGVTGGSLPATIWQRFVNEARKIDPEFSPKLTRVAGFPAKQSRKSIYHVSWNSLTMPVSYEYSEAASWVDFWGRPYGPHPSLIGSDNRPEPRNYRQRGSREPFRPFANTGG